MARLAFRCDGDDRLGAGHVARCLRLAAALERRGADCELIGRHEGASKELLNAAGIASRPPEKGRPAGCPPDADALVVDSYELAHAEIEEAAAGLPLAVVIDGDLAPAGVTVLSYHLDAAERLPDVCGMLGPDYVPVDPRHAATRRLRGNRRVLVTVGGGNAGSAVFRPVLEELALRDWEHELFIATRDLPLGAPAEVEWGWDREGLSGRMAWADLAVSGAGSTAYELACAGVPALLVIVADNQLQVAEGLDRAGIAVSVEARADLEGAEIGRAWSQVLLRASELATAGPATIDGYGVFRAADGLQAAFAGREPDLPLRYRPATQADSELLLGWRNDPEVRTASRSKELVSGPEHEDWLTRTLADPERTLLVVDQRGRPVGTVRFDGDSTGAEISVTIAPDRRGMGLGSRVIAEASELYLSARPDAPRILAEVREENRASAAAFERAGYVPARVARPPGSRVLAYTLA